MARNSPYVPDKEQPRKGYFNEQLRDSYFLRRSSHLKVEYLIICIICDTDLVNKLILQMYTLHKYK